MRDAGVEGSLRSIGSIAEIRARLRARPLRLVLVAIAVITVFSGLIQVVAPGLVLRFLSVTRTAATKQLFATIGMFMMLFGAVLIHALIDRKDHPVVVLWTSLQKFGASIAVVIGVGRNVFSPLALLVASFDLLSGVLGLVYWSSIRS